MRISQNVLRKRTFPSLFCPTLNVASKDMFNFHRLASKTGFLRRIFLLSLSSGVNRVATKREDTFDDDRGDFSEPSRGERNAVNHPRVLRIKVRDMSASARRVVNGISLFTSP